jgi:hypothetical protein
MRNFSHQSSFLKTSFIHQQEYVFQKFNRENYSLINQNLERLAKQTEATIVHTDLTGNRGVDFKFKDGHLHMMLAFEPKHSVDII